MPSSKLAGSSSMGTENYVQASGSWHDEHAGFFDSVVQVYKVYKSNFLSILLAVNCTTVLQKIRI